ncbi:MAG: excinuclease ABC subunit UvrC [Pseudomonadales bacterium]|nr:excinuclease ABC subunit UvrC [Pseudomonadales bacterium]
MTKAPVNSNFDHESYLRSLTKQPGVYRMYDAENNLLYVGKARNLKNRVTSYFRASGLSAKTMALVSRIHRIQITVTASEMEALLLEQSLIKQHRPPYNIVLRDDKSYPYIYLSTHQDYPRLSFHRGTRKKLGSYFGPYPSATSVRDSLNILQRLFQIRQCDDAFFKNRSRPCLQYQIKRCTAPCTQKISVADYRADVQVAELFLQGRNQAVLNHIREAMQKASDELEFERAAKYRDQNIQLQKIQEQQYVHARSGDVDVFAVQTESNVHCVQGMFVRGGRMLGNRTWFVRDQLAREDADLLSAFLSQYYFGSIEREIPKVIVCNAKIAYYDAVKEALESKAEHKVELLFNVRTQRARWLTMAQENAQNSLNTYLAEKRNVFARFVALQELLQLEDVPARLECFDISHTSGEATVASCVVFDTNGPLKSDYRRFNIEGITAGDDYAAMTQALTRRYARLKAGEGKLPDVLIIDGGKGQLGVAREVLEGFQIDNVVILGVAKGESRKPGLETLFVVGQGEVVAPPNGAALHLIQHIRDEAHRFAITGHRQRRGKKRTRSELEGIPGIGAGRRRELLTYFGSISAVKGASKEEISKVAGISSKLATEIYSRLHLE